MRARLANLQPRAQQANVNLHPIDEPVVAPIRGPTPWDDMLPKNEAAWEDVLPWLRVSRHRPTAYDVSQLKAYCAQQPQELHSKGREKYLPLHAATAFLIGELNLEVVKTLLATYPQGARAKEAAGNLPLHFAARSQKGDRGIAIVTALLAAYPQGVHERNAQGKLPVDLAMAGINSGTKVVDLLQPAPAKSQQVPFSDVAVRAATGAGQREPPASSPAQGQQAAPCHYSCCCAVLFLS